jgi:hypothetical protein
MNTKESCDRFEMFLSAVTNATKSHLPTIRQLLESDNPEKASEALQYIQTSLNDLVSSFDRLLSLSQRRLS